MNQYQVKQKRTASLIVSLIFVAGIYNILRQCTYSSDALDFIVLVLLLFVLFLKNSNVLINIIREDQTTLLLLLLIDAVMILHSAIMGFSDDIDLLKYQICILFGVLMFLVGRRLGGNDLLIKSFCDRGCLFLVLFLMIVFKKDEVVYSMGYSYLVLPVLCSVLYKFMLSKSIYCFIEVAIFTLLVMMYGSRGCLVSVAVFFFLCCNKKCLSMILIILCAVFLYIIDVGNIILALMDQFDIESRTLRLLFGDFGHDSGRGDVYNYFIGMIENRPILGYGISSDIALFGMYPHNVFLEILFDFGIIAGGIIIMFMVTTIIVSFTKHKSTTTKKLLFSISCIPLMFSLSYITAPYFWLFLGACFAKNDDEKIVGTSKK